LVAQSELRTTTSGCVALKGDSPVAYLVGVE
jgi:hypothetical protein